ncbi:MAG: hypothetical protein ACLT98_03290 [Eggerthellaceae bacterium]
MRSERRRARRRKACGRGVRAGVSAKTAGVFDLEEWEDRPRHDRRMSRPEDGKTSRAKGFRREERGCSSDLAGHPWDCPAKTASRGSSEGSLGDQARLPASCSNAVATSSGTQLTCVVARRTRRSRRRRNLVFVEENASSLKHGLPSQAVTPKRARYERIVKFPGGLHGMECRVRFDVISILALPNGRALVRHYINASERGAECICSAVEIMTIVGGPHCPLTGGRCRTGLGMTIVGMPDAAVRESQSARHQSLRLTMPRIKWWSIWLPGRFAR